MTALVTCRHIDTCLSCFVIDHHNRPGEMLIGCPIDRNSRVYMVREELMSGIFDDYRLSAPSETEFHNAITAAFAGTHMLKAFDKSLDVCPDGFEAVQAWFLFTWAVDAPAAPDVPPAPIAALAAIDDVLGGECGDVAGGLSPVGLHTFRHAYGVVKAAMPGETATVISNTADALLSLAIARHARLAVPDVEDMRIIDQVEPEITWGTSEAFDAFIIESVDNLFRRGVITEAQRLWVLSFYDVPVPAVAACTQATPCQPSQARDYGPSTEWGAFHDWRTSGLPCIDVAHLPDAVCELVPADAPCAAAIVYRWRRGADRAPCAAFIFTPAPARFVIVLDSGQHVVRDDRASAEAIAWAAWGADIMADAPIYGALPGDGLRTQPTPCQQQQAQADGPGMSRFRELRAQGMSEVEAFETIGRERQANVPETPDVGYRGEARRGSSLGRASVDFEYLKLAGPVRLRRVRLDSGGYDQGGVYWGRGKPLYFAYCPEGDDVAGMYFRALDRASALAYLRNGMAS